MGNLEMIVFRPADAIRPKSQLENSILTSLCFDQQLGHGTPTV